MKQVYGEYLKMQRETREALLTDEGQTTLYNRFRRVGVEFPVAEVEVFHYLAVAEELFLKGDCVHYFFPGADFRDWLREASPPFGAEHREILADHLADMHTAMLHFSGRENAILLALFRPRHPAIDQYAALISRGAKHEVIAAIPPYDEDLPERALSTLRLVAGAIAYIRAFPDMVHEGFPDDLQHPAHFKSIRDRRVVSPSPEIIDRSGPTPHFRSGHFRRLTSERFTKKRGQVIFVHGCFVKGRALLVDGPDSAG